MKALLLFDIDGTLLLTGGCGKVAFDQAFEEIFHIPQAWGGTKPHGKTDSVIMEEISKRTLGRCLTEEEYNQLCDRYLAFFREVIDHAALFHLMPGVHELLKEISKKNNLFPAIATGNLEESAWLKLKRGNIHHYFKCGGFGSDASIREEILKCAVKKCEKTFGEKFSKKEIYVIGDTDYDIKAANNVGLKSIGVKTGDLKTKNFSKHPPTHLLEDLTRQKEFFSIFN